MKRLYFDFAQKGIGYSELDYRAILERVSGESFEDYFLNYINAKLFLIPSFLQTENLLAEILLIKNHLHIY
jgi:hypothetical protein